MIALMSMTMSMAQQITHTIQRGETLASIAQKYGVTEAAIKQANPEASNMIYVGMKLIIPPNTQTQKSNQTTGNVRQLENSQTTPLATPVQSKENATSTSKSSLEETVNSFNIVYYSFDGLKNYGLSGCLLRANNLSYEFNSRGSFEKYSNTNVDLGLNYSFLLLEQESMRLFFTLSIGPSIRMQSVPDPKYIEKTGKVIEGSKEKWYIDAYSNPRLIFQYKKVLLSLGVFFWAPDLKLDKDKGFQTGANFAIGFDL